MNAPHATKRIKEGDHLPAVACRVLRDGRWAETDTEAVFSGRRVVVFGLPGAFTPTCSGQHVPRYNEVAPTLLARGVDEIVCVSVNDPYVLGAWARAQEADHVTFMADGNAEFTAAIGMLVDKSELGFGMRSWRYSMLVEDSVVQKLFAEPNEAGDPYRVSDADTMLKHIDPDASAPDEVVIFTLEGCPHCAHAKEMLEEAGFAYVEFPLEDKLRGKVVRAVTARTTVPQVFINGELIGGEDELQRRLHGASGPPESRPT